MATKRVAIIAANPSKATTTGWSVGFWASEVTHPYKTFKEEGYDVIIASPQGGKIEMDAMSNPHDESQYSAWDEVTKEVLKIKEFTDALENTPSINDLDINKLDAIVIAGGLSPMFTFEQEVDLHKFFSRFYETGKATAALCHGTAVLRYAKDSKGDLLVKGKTVTGFSNGEEDDVDKNAGTKVMPWRIEDELSKLGATFKKGENWSSFSVQDGNLITGQQNMSGEEVAKKVVHFIQKQ